MHIKIKEMRLNRGLSMQALANKIGTTQQQIDRLEKGKRRLTTEWLQKLTRGLECTVPDLVVFDGVSNITQVDIIGAIEPALGDNIRLFSDSEKYRISYRKGANDNDDMFGLVVEGGEYKDFADGTELIFTKLGEKPVAAGLNDKDADFMHKTTHSKGKQHSFAIGDKQISAKLVKSVRPE